MPILSLHHVTATVDDAQDDLDFGVGVLGLRLVKQTVNFDNRHVYHFYYGDARGTPGTIWTTFPYKDQGVRLGTKGAGQVTATAFSVPTGALDSWRVHLASRGIAVSDVAPRFGEPAISFADLSGLDFELIATADDPRPPCTGAAETGSGRAITPDAAIRGLHSVALTVRDPGPTIDFLSTMLGCRVAGESEGRIRLALNGGGPGRTVDVLHNPSADLAVNGIGTVHHVAIAIDSEEEQLEVRQRLIDRGTKVTEVRDRCYFKSIYFREPGGVLLEIATVDPGFAIDEEAGVLGRSLKLPPWEELHRRDIEAALPPVVIP